MVPVETFSGPAALQASKAGHQPGGNMQRNYDGLPAASNVEQAIIQAQLLILKARERDARNLSRSAGLSHS
jgi:hypothetical protein